MSKTKILLFLFPFLIFSTAANATIVSTDVAVGMEILYGDTVDISDSAVGATQAEVYLTGPTTGMEVYSSLSLNSLTDEQAHLDFAFGMDGNNYSGQGYMGQISPDSNYAEIQYSAVTDSVMTYDWDFAYSGSNPFGLQVVQILADGTQLQMLGDYGVPGTHQGSDTYNLIAGNNYTFGIHFYPDVAGAIGGIQGDLIGNLSFDFNGAATEVPEPSAIIFLGTGLIGLIRFRRKKLIQ